MRARHDKSGLTMPGIRLCLHSSSVPDASLAAMLTRCQRDSISAIELRLVEWQAHGLTPHASGAQRRQARDMIGDAGVVLAAIGSDLHLGRDGADQIRSMLEFAGSCGARLLRVFLDERWSCEVAEAHRDKWREWCQTGEDYDVAIAIENHSAFAQLEDLYRASVETGADLLWDVGQSGRAGETVAVSDEALQRVAHIHLKNGRHRDGLWIPTTIAEGDFDIPGLMARLENNKYSGYVSLEVNKDHLGSDIDYMSAQFCQSKSWSTSSKASVERIR